MITAIREVRLAKGLTLEAVARRCDPPTTAQTIGRLETGTRTVSVGWLNRIAAALGVEAGDLVALPSRAGLPVAAALDAAGARAPRRPAMLAAPTVPDGAVAVTVAGSVGEYRTGDAVWVTPLPPERFAEAMHRDVLVPIPAGRFVFGRLVGTAPVTVLPLAAGAKPVLMEPAPAWLGMAVRNSDPATPPALAGLPIDRRARLGGHGSRRCSARGAGHDLRPRLVRLGPVGHNPSPHGLRRDGGRVGSRPAQPTGGLR